VKNLKTRSTNASFKILRVSVNIFLTHMLQKKYIRDIINIHTFKFTAFSLFNPCLLRMKRGELYLKVKGGELKNKSAIQTGQGRCRRPFIGDSDLAATESECPGYRPSLHDTVRSGHTYPSNLLHGTRC
jgi:hypothetical protein